MKKILLMIVPLMALIGCSYDDTDIQKRLDDLDGQLTELQALVKALNSDVTTLKELVAGKRFISDVQPGEDGGYVITLVTAAGETSTITISDGKDGTSSVIGVKQDSDGVYYWTLNGDFILDNGKNFPYRASPPNSRSKTAIGGYPTTTARRGPTADRPRRARICSSPSPRARTASWFT